MEAGMTEIEFLWKIRDVLTDILGSSSRTKEDLIEDVQKLHAEVTGRIRELWDRIGGSTSGTDINPRAK